MHEELLSATEGSSGVGRFRTSKLMRSFLLATSWFSSVCRKTRVQNPPRLRGPNGGPTRMSNRALGLGLSLFIVNSEAPAPSFATSALVRIKECHTNHTPGDFCTKLLPATPLERCT